MQFNANGAQPNVHSLSWQQGAGSGWWAMDDASEEACTNAFETQFTAHCPLPTADYSDEDLQFTALCPLPTAQYLEATACYWDQFGAHGPLPTVHYLEPGLSWPDDLEREDGD